jgi:flagellar protein FliO/FliZ
MAESSTASRLAIEGVEPVNVLGAGGAGALGQTFFWLLLVVSLILLLAWIARRIGGIQLQNAGAIKVLSMLQVGNKERIALVQVGNKQLLIGIAPGRVNTLHVFEQPVIKKSLESGLGTGSQEKQSFQKILLNSVTGKRS